MYTAGPVKGPRTGGQVRQAEGEAEARMVRAAGPLPHPCPRESPWVTAPAPPQERLEVDPAVGAKPEGL